MYIILKFNPKRFNVKNVFIIFYNLLLCIFSQNIFEGIKNKKYNFFFKIGIFFNIFNLLILFPVLIINSLKTLLFFIIITTIFILLIIIILIIFKNKLEYLNNIIIKLSIYKVDFSNLLKNNLIFNISFSFLLTISFLIYYFLIFSILKFYTGLNIQFYFIIILVYFLITFFLIFVFNLVYYIINKTKSKIFFSIKDYTDFKTSPFLVNIIIVTIVYFVSSFIINTFIKTPLSFLYSIPFSLIFSLPFFWLGSIIKLNKIINFYSLEKNIKIYFNFLEKSIDRKDIITIIRSSFKIFISVLVFIISFLLFLLLDKYIKIGLKIIFFYCICISLFFSYSLFLKNRVNIKIFNKSYYFTCFLFLNILIILTISYLNFFQILINIESNYPFKQFIDPIFLYFKEFFVNINNFFNFIPFLAFLFTPILFILILKISEYINTLFFRITKIIDEKLKLNLNGPNSNLIFGDSMSFYPFIFSLIINYLVLTILYIEIKPFSNFFYNLVKTFQIDSVFKFTFLTEENIYNFFNLLFIISLIVICIKIILNFFSTILSHFMLFNDEIVYLQNKIISKSILRIPLSKINYFIVKQNLIERLLDIGSVYIETQDKNGIIKISGVSSIKEKNILIMEKIKSGLQKTY